MSGSSSLPRYSLSLQDVWSLPNEERTLVRHDPGILRHPWCLTQYLFILLRQVLSVAYHLQRGESQDITSHLWILSSGRSRRNILTSFIDFNSSKLDKHPQHICTVWILPWSSLNSTKTETSSQTDDLRRKAKRNMSDDNSTDFIASLTLDVSWTSSFYVLDFERVVYFRRSPRLLSIELSVGREGHNPMIVFKYNQKHKGTLCFIILILILWNLFSFWSRVFCDIFASCVESDPSNLDYSECIRFHLTKLLCPCVSNPKRHDGRRHEIVVKGLQSIDKIRVTHRSLVELIHRIVMSLVIIPRWTKCQCRFSQLLEKIAYVRFEVLVAGQHLMLFQIDKYYAVREFLICIWRN